MSAPVKEAAPTEGMRVYEYTDQDGNVFWSFKKYPAIVTPSRVMTLRDRVGVHFENYVSELRILRRLILEKDADAMAERG